MTEEYGVANDPKAPRERLLRYPGDVKAEPPKLFKTLMARLEHELPKPPRCTKVVVKKISDHYFRANFFAPVTANDTGALAVRGWELLNSRFLKVSEEDGTLAIQDATKVG